jgi:hypothetical protein
MAMRPYASRLIIIRERGRVSIFQFRISNRLP